MISHAHRCIFVHIPKTAGNSINRVFGVGWEDHKDMQRYFDEQPQEVFESYFKFAIVRNPWDRLLSDYNYQVKKSRAKASKLFVFNADGSKRSFAEWAEIALGTADFYDASSWGGCVSAHIHRCSPQIEWITVEGRKRTDFIARLEHLSEDFRAVCERVGLPSVRLPHRNRRLHWHYSHYYDRATRDLVAKYYARDIEQFGYEFEPAFFRIAVHWPGVRRAPAPAPETVRESSSKQKAVVASRPSSRPSAPAPARVPLWRRPPGFAAAASVLGALSVFSLSSVGSPLTAMDTATPPTRVQKSVREIIVQSAAPASAPAQTSRDFVARAHRLRRTLAELKLSVDFLPALAPGGIVTLSSEPETGPRDYMSTAAPAISHSGSGPAPRWWLRRNRENQDD